MPTKRKSSAPAMPGLRMRDEDDLKLKNEQRRRTQTAPERLRSDSGSGLRANRSETGGLGLRRMRYRAGVSGERLEIARAKPRGTSINCTLNTAVTDG